MTEQSDNQQAQQAQLPDRLGPAHVGLRADLEVHRHVFSGKSSYVIRDPLTLQCHRVPAKEYQILVCLTPEHSLSDVFTSLVESGKLKEQDEKEFYEFVVSLHRMAFLQLPISDDKVLYRRHQAKQAARRKEKLMSFISMRIPLFDPDTFLSKTEHLVSVFFTRWFFFVWVGLMVLGAVIVSFKHDEIFADVMSTMFRPTNIFAMWLILIVLKTFHEFGHAYACKVLGGSVSEMGVYLIVMTPCAYVDVTSSWGFPRKLDRIIVALGGVYAESYIAIIALILWALCPLTALGELCRTVFFMASALTVLVNINPLMRFDGYYILGDLVEIPNLRQRSQKYVLQILKRLFLNIRTFNDDSFSVRVLLVAFGIAGSLYKVTVILAISAIIATKAFLVGLLMSGLYVLSTLSRIVYKLVAYLWLSPESAHVRVRAIAMSVILLIIMPACLFLLPVPSYLLASGQMAKENEIAVRAQQEGFVKDITAKPGMEVKKEHVLMRLDNTEILQKTLETQAELESSQVRLAAYGAMRTTAPSALKQKKVTETLETTLAYHREELERLEVIAPTDGQLINCMSDDKIGSYVHIGEALAVVASGKWIAKVLLSEQDIAKTQPTVGQHVEYRLASGTNGFINGEITRISPEGSRIISHQALTTLGGGDIAVNALTGEATQPYYELTVLFDNAESQKPRYGMTGNIRLKCDSSPVGISIVRRLLRFINSLY